MPRTGRPSASNIIYNEELKKRYIDENYTNLGTKERYLKVFKRTGEFEEEKGKDIYNFTLEEIKDIILSLSSASRATLRSTVSILNKYVAWAIKEGFLDSYINVIDEYLHEDKIKNMTSKLALEHRYLKSEFELDKVINLCVNAQDAVGFVLAWHGVKVEDMLNIKKSDIDFDNNIILLDNRKIQLNDKYMQVVQEALYQTTYEKMNGKSKANATELLLEDSEYLIRGVQNITRKTRMTKQVVNNRIKRIIEAFGEKDQEGNKVDESMHRQLITLTTVFYSGMFCKLKELESERPLTPEDFMKAREDYNLSPVNYGDTQNRYNDWKKTL